MLISHLHAQWDLYNIFEGRNPENAASLKYFILALPKPTQRRWRNLSDKWSLTCFPKVSLADYFFTSLHPSHCTSGH